MKILWISDSVNIYSGFGTQSYAVLQHLSKSHQVMQLGWFCYHETDYDGIQVKPLKNNFGDIDTIREYYYEFDPDVVISLGDIRMVEKLIYQFEDYVFKSKWIHWLPIDGEPYPEMYNEHIQNIEHLVTMSDFGYDLYKTRISSNIHKIYHGIDPNIYHPLDNKEIVRARHGFHNRFVCLMVATNQWRKNIPAMIEAFAKFSKGKKNVDLIIHTKPISVAGHRGWNLEDVKKINNVGDEVKISWQDYTPIKMNRLYNCANLLVSSTQGEGFGLPHVEAMFAGLPLLLPDYTTSREQILPDDDESRRCGELIRIASFQTQSEVHVKRAIIDINDCAEKLEGYYNDWLHGETKIRTHGKMGRQNALKRYDINKITRQWDALIFQVARWQKQNILQSHKLPVTLTEI